MFGKKKQRYVPFESFTSAFDELGRRLTALEPLPSEKKVFPWYDQKLDDIRGQLNSIQRQNNDLIERTKERDFLQKEVDAVHIKNTELKRDIAKANAAQPAALLQLRAENDTLRASIGAGLRREGNLGNELLSWQRWNARQREIIQRYQKLFGNLQD